MIDCHTDFYVTSTKKAFKSPGPKFAKLAKPIPSKDPNLIPYHVFNNITVRDFPVQSKTWERPDLKEGIEEYESYLEKLKQKRGPMFKQHFTNPDVNVSKLVDDNEDSKLTSYEHIFSPNDHLSLKESLKWSRIKGDTSIFSYQERLYRTQFNRISEITREMSELARPLNWHHDDTELKNDLRKIYRSKQTTYYREICELRVNKLKHLRANGKLYEDPIDPHTQRRIGQFIPQKDIL